jgi:predicted lysophospholipase L1 biosynthesis ABC-type transport system permease subunit
MYVKYPVRSLFRGGQRTLLAIFCMAVGVMAIVALQLVGLMINNAFDTNVRDANGGDIAVRSQNQPFTQNDLSTFNDLKKNSTITNYTALINAQGSTSLNASLRQSFTVRVIDAQNYPVVSQPIFLSPKNGIVAKLVKDNQVVVTQSFIDQYKKKVGDSFNIHVGSREQSGRTVHVKIVGIVDESGVLSQSGSVILLSLNDYKAADPKPAVYYDMVDVTAQKDQISTAVKKIQDQFPIANVQTAQDALKQQQSSIDNIRKFLEIAGLLALLIGGVGIVNTMQVLLSRRKTEIAMLKTTGYRRFDLYMLFGLEAGILGLIGGAIGAGAAVGVSYLVRNLVQQTFQLRIPFMLDPVTIGGGLVIGVATALIFGLLPIVQAGNIRPLNVIRDLPEGRGAVSMLLTVFLLIVLSVLFCGLSIFILNDVQLGVLSVYGTFIFLGILSLFFGLVVLAISKLPVPESFSWVHMILVVLGLALGGAVYRVSPVFGGLLIGLAVVGILVLFMPRSWKANIKMALRNIGRQRARTTTTMLALFVGIFTIGLVLVLGQDLRDNINRAVANTLSYNVISITANKDTTKLQDKININAIPGLSKYQHHTLASTVPVSIDDKPLAAVLPRGNNANASSTSLGRSGTLYYLSGVEGYDAKNNQIPSLQDMKITSGRNLNVSDAGTNNVVVTELLSKLDPLHLKRGDKIVMTDISRTHWKMVTVVGFYQQNGFGSNLYPIMGAKDLVSGLSPAGSDQSVFYMKIDPNQVSKAVDVIGNTVPNAFLLNLANIRDIINQIINDVLITLTTIASLWLLAGIIIIANAVALAMLERRRELGILKSVGYTRGSILSEVLIENGVVGGTGAVLAMLLVALATTLLGQLVFKVTFGVSVLITWAMIGGAIVLAMLAAILVAWGAVRVRPLEVLRYE